METLFLYARGSTVSAAEACDSGVKYTFLGVIVFFVLPCIRYLPFQTRK